MEIYAFLLFSVLFYAMILKLNHNSERARKLFLFLSFATMTLILGLRGETVGEDTDLYLNIFDRAAEVKWSSLLESTGLRAVYYTYYYGYSETIEIGFLALNKFFQFFSENGHLFLLLIATLTCGLVAKFIYENTENVFLPTWIFMCESMYMNSFNTARQMLAIAIAMQAYTLLKNKKIKSALLVIFLAVIIHSTALASLIMLPIMSIKENEKTKAFKYVFTAILILPFLMYFLRAAISTVFPYLEGYFTVNYWQNSLGISSILWLLELVLLFVMYRKRFHHGESFQLGVLALAYIVLEVAGLQITMFSRLGWYFNGYLLLFFPNALQYFAPKTRRLLNVMLVLFLALIFISYASSPTRAYMFYWQ